MPVYATGFLERVLAPVSGLCVVSIIFWQAYCLFSHLCAVCRLSTDNWEVNRRCSQLHAVWLWQLQLSRACSRAWDHRLPLSFSCESRLAACFCFGFIVKPPPQSEGLTRLQRPYSICLFVHILSEMSMVCSTKVLCPQNLSEKIAKIQRSHVPLCGHTTFVLLTTARTLTTIDEIRIFCSDVNKTSTCFELLAVNILCYFFIKK